MCNNFKNETNENKEFEANSTLLNRQAPNELGLMLPCSEDYGDFACNELPYLLSYLISIRKTPTIQTIEM